MKCITEPSTKIHRPGHPEDSVKSSGPPLQCTNTTPAEDEQHEKLKAINPNKTHLWGEMSLLLLYQKKELSKTHYVALY